MTGREFFAVSDDLLKLGSEAHERAAVGRAYYGLLPECRHALRRWGISLPPRFQIHFFVKSRFSGAKNVDLHRIGHALEQLGRWRNLADYDLASQAFVSSSTATRALAAARSALHHLDQIEADPQRRAQAIAAVKAVP